MTPDGSRGWDDLRRLGLVEEVSSGDAVFHQGDPADRTYVVLSGRCAVVEGDEQVNELGPGDLFGEIAALAGGERTATVVAVDDAELLVLSPRQLREELASSPDLLWQSIRLLVERLGMITRRQIAYRSEHRELREVQRSLLPDLATIPADAGFTLSGAWEPCTYASGDYYDAIDLGGGRWLIALGDVMGHGAQASLTMGIARAQVRHLAGDFVSTGELLASLDAYLRANAPPRHGMSMVLVAFDRSSGSIEYSSAGHPFPLLARDGAVSALDGRSGLLLALPFDREGPYPAQTLTVESGDRLLLFTDGLFEVAVDGEGSLLGIDGLMDIFASTVESAADVVEQVARRALDDVADDDRTAVMIEFDRTGVR